MSPGVDGVVIAGRCCSGRAGKDRRSESPAEFADALASVAPPVPLPDPAPAMPSGTLEQRYDRSRNDGYGGYPPNPNDPGTWALPDRGRGGGGSYQRGYQTQERSAASRAVISVVIVLVLAAVAATAWVISTSLHKSTSSNSNQATKTPRTSASSPAAAGSTVLKPVGDSTFNILGSPPGNTEDPESAGLAIDNSLSTAWATSYYFQANFGGLKSGTGLLIDMGREVRLNQVSVLFGSQCCTTAEIYLGNSNAMPRTALSNFTKVAPACDVDRTTRLHDQLLGYWSLRSDLADRKPAAHARAVGQVPGTDLQRRYPRERRLRRGVTAGHADGRG